ncbi:IclR family transcriptional regulator [Thermodesulfobacteriota bacterium]
MAIQSVDRSLNILSLFSHRRPLLGVSEISRSLRLPKGTVHGLIRTLVNQGFLRQDQETRKYRLGLKLYELGIILAGTLEINQKAAQPAHQLAKRTQLLSRIAIWDGDSVMITLNAYPRPYAVLPHQIGPRVHAYCSAIGKAILAFLGDKEIDAYFRRTKLIQFTPSTITIKRRLLAELKETSKRGYSIDRAEAVQGLGCVGAPIFNREGSVAGSISISGATHRVIGERMEYLAEELLKTAAEISQYMGHFTATLEA